MIGSVETHVKRKTAPVCVCVCVVYSTHKHCFCSILRTWRSYNKIYLNYFWPWCQYSWRHIRIFIKSLHNIECVCACVCFHLCFVPRAAAPGDARWEYSDGTLVWDPISHHRKAEINISTFNRNLKVILCIRYKVVKQMRFFFLKCNQGYWNIIKNKLKKTCTRIKTKQ